MFKRSTKSLSAGLAVTAVAVALASCGSADAPKFQGVDLEAEPPELLSDMNLMRWEDDKVVYEDNVEPYTLAVPLFSDYALKDRAVYIPEGTQIEYDDNDVFEYPVGTVILKSFMFPADFRSPTENVDLIEVRVLVRYEDGWRAYPYLWDPTINDAVLTVQGQARVIDFIDEDGLEQSANYLVPQKNQCQDCHELKDLETDENYITPIGNKARHMNRDSEVHAGENQLQHLADIGWLNGMPALNSIGKDWDERDLETTAVADMDSATLEKAARDYMDINCAHCHNPAGLNGISSQLFLNYDNEDEFRLGFCKKPGSAGKGGEGRDYDIVPGNAEASILVYRTETLEVGAQMPLLGRSLAHGYGVEILRAWIDGLPPDDCEAPMP